MNEVLISLGSNIDKETNLPTAIARLAAEPGLTVTAVSAVLETPAIGPDGSATDQPAYHNAALRACTTLSLPEVRALLRTIEADMGRVRGPDKFAPRPIDLDLAYYGDPHLAVTTGELPGGSSLPLDGDALRHAHIALPLAEVAPDWVHPQTGATLAALAAAFAVEQAA